MSEIKEAELEGEENNVSLSKDINSERLQNYKQNEKEMNNNYSDEK